MSASSKHPALLRLEDVWAAYGRVQALFGVSLEVGEGEIVALLGPNGAGKSTTLRVISGVLPARGAVHLGSTSIAGEHPDVVARLGVAHVPEGRGLFPTLTVLENLRIGTFVGRGDAKAELDRVFEIFPVLERRQRQLAGTLSGGEQQMLAIARALVSRPRLLMIDELSLGLAPAVVEDLFGLIPSIAASGTAVLLVEQFVGSALAIATRAFVLEMGRVSWSGEASVLAGRQEHIESSYLGRSGGTGNGERSEPFREDVRVPVAVTELRALQREAARTGTTVEQLLAARLEGKR